MIIFPYDTVSTEARVTPELVVPETHGVSEPPSTLRLLRQPECLFGLGLPYC